MRNREARLHAASDWLLRLHNDEMSPQQVTDWVEWSEGDPHNLEAFEQMKKLLLDVKGLDTARKQEALHRLIPQDEGRRPLKAGYALAAGVAIVLVALGCWVLREQGRKQPFADSYATPRAEMQRLSLPDGTVVKLGPRSQLTVNYTAQSRNVVLREGEAFFDVETDAARPFSVDAGAWQLKDIGTAFNVRKTRERIVVTVAEGIVDVTRKADAPASRPLRVVAGEEVVVEASERPISLARVDSRAAVSWEQGHLRFKDEPLSAVVANLNRYSPRELIIADPAIGAMQFSGTVLVENVDGWLDAVCRVFRLQQESDGQNKVRLVRSVPTPRS